VIWTPLAVLATVALLAGCAAVAAAGSLRVLREYERAVVFRLGRLRTLRGPGPVFLVPLVDRMVRVDLRTVALTIPPQEAITRDNVPVRVNTVAYFRVVNPTHSVTEVENYAVATSQLAQTTLRSVLGRHDLDALLAERDRLGTSLQRILDEQTEPWGVKVTLVEIKDVEIPEAMQRAIGRQAEAERERRAKVISAQGEVQAAHNLRDAAAKLAEHPTAIQLRYLQTLVELGSEGRSTVVFPVPVDLPSAQGQSPGTSTGASLGEMLPTAMAAAASHRLGE
jgi:regulator of protease activity HflC (stomatin/prohibitin superfamily)